ncbi:DUF4255 domain-containing protein [Aliikangiella marina]|uniref:DUF4255 domain-containing protein n=1 Tax=Aliikangiella marina TaxID=1712262 RepID=A0A545T2T5_9GAMM|nr:DUF4255 domain-containing protein [Aliikangiella marina]TQV71495.1 DUF4255 domain-containing protein [Aliikangiella marina]
MASYHAVNAVLLALENFFTERLPNELTDGPINARVELLGSSDITSPISGNVLGIYLHRLEIDAHGRARHFTPTGTSNGHRVSELPVNLHLLLIASASSATIEANLMAWAMIELANNSQLDISHLSENDSDWTEKEILTITPAEMSNEDLMRIWDVFESDYTSSVPYIGRTIRLRLQEPESIAEPVTTRVFPTGKAISSSEEAVS